MGLSSSKSKTKNDPWAPAQPYILKGMQQTSSVFDQNQPALQQMSTTLENAANAMAPNVFGANSLISGAQSTLGSIYNGGYMGKNPGASTYNGLMNAGANDPSMGILNGLATRGTGAYDSIGASNPALSKLDAMSNSTTNPLSQQFYADTLSGKYLNANPYLDDIVKQGTDAATKAANARFAASGMGEGMSTPYAQALGSSVADANNQLRYGAYKDELGRMGTIGAQSDNEYDTTQARNLSAATGLGSLYNDTGRLRLDAQTAGDSQQLAAAQGLGDRYNANNVTALNAAQGADSNYNDQISQILQSLSLAPGLRDADFAGVSPLLSLYNTAADIPYVGTAALNGQIRQASNGYGTQTVTNKGSLLDNLEQMSRTGKNFASAYSGFGG